MVPCCLWGTEGSSIGNKVCEGVIAIFDGAMGFSIFDGTKWSNLITKNITVTVVEPKLT